MSEWKSDPLLLAIVQRLPPPGSEWAAEDQRKWLSLLNAALLCRNPLEPNNPCYPWPTAPMVDAGARALFEKLFKAAERLDGNHIWAQADERIKAGMRDEARVVLLAALPDPLEHLSDDMEAPGA